MAQLDGQWKAFTDLLKSNFQKQKERYLSQRKEAVETMTARCKKWEEVQAEIQQIIQKNSGTAPANDVAMEPSMEELANMPWDIEEETISDGGLEENTEEPTGDAASGTPAGNALRPFRQPRQAESPPDKVRRMIS